MNRNDYIVTAIVTIFILAYWIGLILHYEVVIR